VPLPIPFSRWHLDFGLVLVIYLANPTVDDPIGLGRRGFLIVDPLPEALHLGLECGPVT
jgi:hypothetical protein